MRPIRVTPNAAKDGAALMVGDETFTLSTAEVDALLLRLLEARPLMQPLPELPSPPPPRPDLYVIVESLHVHPDHERGGVLLHLASPSLGWTTWQLSPPLALALREFLGRHCVQR